MKRPLILLAAALSLRAQSGTVNVEVRDALTKAPLPNVELTLSRGAAPAASWDARTGADGRAQFDHLPPGAFYVGYKLPGYLDTGVSGASRLVQVKDGGAASLTIALMPATTVEGTVLDEDGNPMEGVTVHTSGSEAATGRDGHYRLDHVNPGPCRIGVRIPTALRKKTLTHDDTTGESFGYPGAAYYPGVADPEAATVVQIAGGMDLHGYDIRLRRVTLTDLTGRLVARAGGDPLADAYVELQTTGLYPPPDDTFQPRAVEEGGGFRFELIQPASYVLLVYPGERGTGLPYVVPIAVGKTGVRDREIVVPAFQTIQGTVKTKDGSPWRGEISLLVMTEQKGVAHRGLTIRGDQFALDDMPPGQWQIGLQSTVTRVQDRGKLTITAARFGLNNPLTGPILVTESGNPPLEIELSGDTGKIAGTVTGAHTGYVVIQRVGAPRFFLNAGTRIREDGSFLAEDLAPGLYDVAFGGAKPVKIEVKSGDTTVVHLESKR